MTLKRFIYFAIMTSSVPLFHVLSLIFTWLFTKYVNIWAEIILYKKLTNQNQVFKCNNHFAE